MPNQTENYQLNQWEPEDAFLRTDFNADNAKIDAALADKCGAVFGTYTGDGTESRTITLGFRATALYLCNQMGVAGSTTGSGYCYGGLALPGHPVTRNDVEAVTLTETGFILNAPNDYYRVNQSGKVYHYIAFK